MRLPEAIRLADGSMLFDNSASSGPRLLLRIRRFAIDVNHLDEADRLHRRLAEAVGTELSLSGNAVFYAARRR